jgi:hypothetical protein
MLLTSACPEVEWRTHRPHYDGEFRTTSDEVINAKPRSTTALTLDQQECGRAEVVVADHLRTDVGAAIFKRMHPTPTGGKAEVVVADQLAMSVPPPRFHRVEYSGVLGGLCLQ